MSRLATSNASTDTECRLEEVLNNQITVVAEFNFNTEKLIHSQRNDPMIQDIIDDCVKNNSVSTCKNFKLTQEILYKSEKDGQELLFVPYDLVEALLNFYHNSDHILHLSEKRLYDVLRHRFYWPGIYRDTADWVGSCIQCKKHKTNQQKANGLLIPIITTEPKALWCVDIEGPLKTTKDGFKYILTCIDHFTCWVEAAPLNITLEYNRQGSN